MSNKRTFILSLFLFCTVSSVVRSATYTVTKTADTNDGSCSASDCSLREAMAAANANASAPHTISFNIPSSDANCTSSGVCSISPTSALPTITKSVTINGYTQNGASANTTDFPAALNTVIKIEISGSRTPNGTDGFTVNAANVTLKGLAIYGFPSASGTYTAHGIQMLNTVGVTALKVQGCFIGVRADGDTVAANKGNGIYISGARNTGSVIGSDGDGLDEAAERNLISGNDNYGIWLQGSQTTVAGNFIGLDKDGDTDLGNRWVGLYDAVGSNIIGTDGDGVSDEVEGNVISGNNTHGIRVASGSNTVIAGNIIGLGAGGVTAIKNSGHGILVSTTGSGVRIGTNEDGIADESEANVVSGNGSSSSYANISISSSNVTVRGNLIGMTADGSTVVVSAGSGISVSGSSNTIEDNEIAGHVTYGVYISSGSANLLTGNSFHDNTGLAIALASGANNNKAAPVIASQTAGDATLIISGSAAAGDTVELFDAVDGEGATSLGGATADADGDWSISTTSLVRGDTLVALAYDAISGSSAFSDIYTVANQAPLIADVLLTTEEDNSTSGTLTGTDADGDAVTYELVSNTSQGLTTLALDVVTFTPTANLYGADSLSYRAYDGIDYSETKNISIEISAVNDSPLAGDITAGTITNEPVTLELNGSDPDPDDDLSYSFDSDNVSGSGTDYVYTPDTDTEGTDSFTYTICDAEVCTNGTVTVVVSPYNDCYRNIPEEYADQDMIVGQAYYTVSIYSRYDTGKPARRILVNLTIYNGVTDTNRTVTTTTDDDGCYYVSYNGDEEILQSRTLYAIASSSYSRVDGGLQGNPDGIAPDYCNGAVWELRSLDATSSNEWGVGSVTQDNNADFVYDGSMMYPEFSNVPIGRTTLSEAWMESTESITFYALDVALSTMELACSADDDADFGVINISEDTTNNCDNEDFGCYAGTTNTIYYGHNDITYSHLHMSYVVAHEFGHYLQDEFYTERDYDTYVTRLSSNQHSYDDLLDPRMAFFEGFAAGVGEYITYQYWSEMHSNLETTIDPGAGIAMESNVGSLFYELITTDGYGTIHQVYGTDMPDAPVFQTMHSFGYYYSLRGGSVDPFVDVGIPTASLGDLYDSQNYLGQYLGSFYALYPRIVFDLAQGSHYFWAPMASEYPDEAAADPSSFDFTDDEFRYNYLSYHLDWDYYQDYTTLYSEDVSDVGIFLPLRNSSFSADITPGHTVSQHDLITFVSPASDEDKQTSAGASRWFVVDGNQFSTDCAGNFPGPCSSVTESVDGYTRVTFPLEISDDSPDGDRCVELLNIVAYKDGDFSAPFASASGYCPSMDLSTDGTYIVEVYSTDITRDVACFSFMDEHYCEENP